MELTEWTGPDYEENAKQYMDRMKASGYEVLLPSPTTVFVDIDTEEQFNTFKSQRLLLLSKYPQAEFAMATSRNGLPGRHIVITLPFATTPIEKIAIQAAMGSDPMRELLSFFRYQKQEIPTMFVEYKTTAFERLSDC